MFRAPKNADEFLSKIKTDTEAWGVKGQPKAQAVMRSFAGNFFWLENEDFHGTKWIRLKQKPHEEDG